jgi:hypothetical protein
MQVIVGGGGLLQMPRLNSISAQIAQDFGQIQQLQMRIVQL